MIKNADKADSADDDADERRMPERRRRPRSKSRT